jgi:hypothetical protein
MNAYLHYILAQQRVADLQRDAEQARLATDAGTRRSDSGDLRPIVRALPSPTAHPSPEAWPDAQRAADQMLLAVAPDHTLTRERNNQLGASEGSRALGARTGAPPTSASACFTVNSAHPSLD